MIKAVLASVTIKGWGAQQTDEAVGAEVAALKGADLKAGRYVKNLIDPKALRGMKGAAMEIRKAHYEMTRPWDDTGRRLLPGALFDDYMERIRTLISKYEFEVRQFAAEMPRLKEQARIDLGLMFDESAYPDPAVIELTCKADYNFEPLPSGDALPATLRELAADVEAQTKTKLQAGHQALFHRTAKAIEELGRKIKHYDEKREAGDSTKLRSSLLNDVRVLAQILPALNVEGDPFLNDMANRMEAKFSSLSVDEIKDSDVQRDKAMAEVEAMMEMMKARADD